MGRLVKGDVVVLPFPYSDLSHFSILLILSKIFPLPRFLLQYALDHFSPYLICFIIDMYVIKCKVLT